MILGEYTCCFCEEEYDDLIEVVNQGNLCQDCFDREYDKKIYYQVWFQIDKNNLEDMGAQGGLLKDKEYAKRMAKSITGGIVMEVRPIFRNPVDFGEAH